MEGYAVMSVNWTDPAILVAVLGLAGSAVAYVVRANAEKLSANKAVLAEVKRLLEVIREHKHWYEKNEHKHDSPLIPFSYVVYKKQVDTIGVLRGDLVADVVEFYGFVDFLNALQAARKDYKDPAEFEAVYSKGLKDCDSRFFRAFNKYLAGANIDLPSSPKQ
jgi:hypothetical protein